MRSVLLVVAVAVAHFTGIAQPVNLHLPKQPAVSEASIAVLLVGFGVTALAAQQTVVQNEGDLYKGIAVATFVGTVSMNINWRKRRTPDMLGVLHQ